MKTISADKAKQMKKEGYIFKPHNLYQDEKTDVLVQITPRLKRAYQVIKNGH